MAQILKTSYSLVSTISDKTVAFLKNSLNIFLDTIVNGIKFKKNETGSYVYYYYKYIL